jgi:hypothetical protein
METDEVSGTLPASLNPFFHAKPDLRVVRPSPQVWEC